ncbi:MAG: amidohydrolase family protein [Kineosporiaceae bacterium]
MDATANADAQPLRWRRFVACGDSFTEGMCDPADHAAEGGGTTAWRGWADRTASALAEAAAAGGGTFEYANLAVRGRLLGRIVAEQVPAALALEPDLVSLVGGGNDTLRPRCDIDALAATLESAVVRLRHQGADVLLSTATNPAASPVLRHVRGRAAAWTAAVWSIAGRHGCRVLDLWGLHALYHPRMWAADRIHLSPEGHRRVALLALETLGVPDTDASWRRPLPVPSPVRRTEALREDAAWARTYLAPWVSRRLRGRSSGDTVTPKRPVPGPVDAGRGQDADLLLTGRVRLPGGGVAEAVAVRGDRIVGVGTRAELDALAGPRTARLDAGSGLVLPGFVDAHVHPPIGGAQLRGVWLHDVRGLPAYQDAVAAYAAAHPDRPWIVGGGWAMEHFPGGTPRKEDLDAVVGDRPVFLMNRDVHGAWVNSAALRAAGIDATTPDPPDGRIERDPATGEPTGTLHEGAAYRMQADVLPQPGPDDVREAILAAQAHLHALGITSWQDAWVTPQTQEAYRALAAEGLLTARVTGALWWDRDRGLEQVEELLGRRGAGYAADGRVPGFHPTHVKIMLDGVLENRTASLLEPYLDPQACGCMALGDAGPGTATGLGQGLSYVPREVLIPALTALDAAGVSVHLHAIGDAAVRDALDAVEVARSENGPRDAATPGRRHQVAHLQVLDPEDVARFGRLGVIANLQAYWAQSEPQMDVLTVPCLGPERAAGQYPFAALAAANAPLAMGSDWPVTTADPLAQVEVAVRRVDPHRRDVAPFLPEQRLTLDQALDAFTSGSAYACGDDDAGVIAVGRRADLVVLDVDPTAPDAGPPADARVVATVAAGRMVHGPFVDRLRA